MSLLTWVYRLVVLCAIGLALNSYSPTGGQAGASYVEELQQALYSLKEIARILQ